MIPLRSISETRRIFEKWPIGTSSEKTEWIYMNVYAGRSLYVRGIIGKDVFVIQARNIVRTLTSINAFRSEGESWK